MRKITILILISGILAVLCLMLSSPDKWIINLVLLLFLGAIHLVFRKQHSFWLSTISFVVYSTMAIWGLLEQSSSLLLISGELFAFSAWELIVFRNDLKGDLQTDTVNQLINQHIRALFPVILAAGLISFLFLNIHFKLPFMVILLTGVLGIFGFFHFYRTFSRQ